METVMGVERTQRRVEMHEDEKFVREHWETVEAGDTFAGFSIYLLPNYWPTALQGFERESVAWQRAAVFTRERVEQIRQVEEEIAWLSDMLDWDSPDHKVVERIQDSRKAALTELKRGMK